MTNTNSECATCTATMPGAACFGCGTVQPTDGPETCATCGTLIDPPTDETTAHWGGPHSVVIVAWTCSEPCSDAYEAQR